ncbi:MAG TPA: hypothetical protein VK857_06640, partial [Desulforhopalus sp.]|nr:hypothetical protein [Desulforhopalus sp.]
HVVSLGWYTIERQRSPDPVRMLPANCQTIKPPAKLTRCSRQAQTFSVPAIQTDSRGAGKTHQKKAKGLSPEEERP